MISRNSRFLHKSLKEQEQILKELENLSNVILESKITLKAKKYYHMACSVSKEIHYHKMFTRLKIESEGILSGIIQPEHAIEDILLKFFYHRFPKFIIILQSTRKKKTYFIAPLGLRKWLDDKQVLIKPEQDYLIGKTKLDLKGLLKLLLPFAQDNPLFKGVLDADLDLNKLFKEFYNSQHIDSRENYRLFIQNMPKKYQKKKDMIVEKTFRTKTLDKFGLD